MSQLEGLSSVSATLNALTSTTMRSPGASRAQQPVSSTCRSASSAPTVAPCCTAPSLASACASSSERSERRTAAARVAPTRTSSCIDVGSPTHVSTSTPGRVARVSTRCSENACVSAASISGLDGASASTTTAPVATGRRTPRARASPRSHAAGEQSSRRARGVVGAHVGDLAHEARRRLAPTEDKRVAVLAHRAAARGDVSEVTCHRIAHAHAADKDAKNA